jgi:hypothetical protein
MSCQQIALIAFAVAAAVLTGAGIQESLGVPAAVGYAVGIALHLGWVPAAAQRRSPMLVLLCWPVCWSYANDGVAKLVKRSGEGTALIVELAVLLLALSLKPAAAWTERLASFRRAKNAVLAQWDLLTETSRPVGQAEQDRLMAEMDDARAFAAEASRGMSGVRDVR